MKIAGLEVIKSPNNAIHTTYEDLNCFICNKKCDSINVLKEVTWYEIEILVCSNCLFEQMNRLFEKQEVIEMCKIEKIITSKAKMKKERSKMTLKLRYEILKRDNFMCIKCGNRPPNCTLEVDHIRPISKGGLSIKKNLQTLCNNCNSGKSNS